MKKLTAILLSVLLVFSLAACGNNQQATDTTPEPSSEPVSETTSEPEKADESSETSSASQSENEDNTVDTDVESTGGKTLIVYYSASGNTEEVANYTDADLNWTDDDSRVSREHDNEEERNVPLVSDTVDNWDEYDTVFIGYPIWWGIAAWPVDGFIKANDFTGKTVIPFCTSASSGLGESGELLEEMAGTGEWLEGERFRSGASEETVRSWVEGLGL